MRALSIGLIALFFFKSNAQVKEINFLGKEWYLHGYDFRFGYISHSLDYGSDMLRNRSSIDTDNIDMNFVTVHEIITGDNPVKNITFGLVFRPYQRSHLNLLRQLEIGHSLGLRWFNNKINVKNLAGQTFTNGKYKGSFIDYSPSITISSKPIVNQFKFYFTGRAETAVPLSNALELSSVDSSLMTNGNLKRTFQTTHTKILMSMKIF